MGHPSWTWLKAHCLNSFCLSLSSSSCRYWTTCKTEKCCKCTSFARSIQHVNSYCLKAALLLQKWGICQEPEKQVRDQLRLQEGSLYWFSRAKKWNFLLLKTFSLWKNKDRLSPLQIIAICCSGPVCTSCAQCKIQHSMLPQEVDRIQWSIPGSIHDGHSQDTAATVLKHNHYSCTIITIINTTIQHL